MKFDFSRNQKVEEEMDYRKKTDEEMQILLEETDLEFNEIRKSGRDTYSIRWKVQQVRAEILRRKLKLHEKKVSDLVSMTQDSIKTMNKIYDDWEKIKKSADESTYKHYKKLQDYEYELQNAIHLQINSPT